MAYMKRHDWPLIGKVEMFIQRPGQPFGFRRDLFGWMDILAQGPDGNWYGVQSCAMSGRAAHVAKLNDPLIRDNIVRWMDAPTHRAELWAWRKVKVKRGGVAVRWEVERTELIAPETSASPVRPTAGAGGVSREYTWPLCHRCGRDMATVSGGTGNVTHDGRLWCGCPEAKP